MEEDKKGREDAQQDHAGPHSDDHAKSPQKEVLEKRTDQGDQPDQEDENNVKPASPQKKTEDKTDTGQGEPPLRSAVDEVERHKPEPKMFDTSGQDTNE
jgi:hypothetical protein